MNPRIRSAVRYRVVLLALLLCLIPNLQARADEDAAATGAINGRVTDVVTGAPLARVTVSIPNTSVPDALTDADGRYRLTDVRAGKCYVEFSTEDGRYAYEYYPDAPIMLLAQEIDVPAGGEVTGIDAALAPRGRITGRVTDAATGRPLAGVRAVARYAVYSRPWWKDAREGITDAAGRYVIEGLWTDIFRVEFSDEAGRHARTQYGNGADVGVLTGEETAGIDAAMTYEGSVTGRVTDRATGAPLANATVSAYPADNFAEEALVEVRADDRGGYVIRGLAAGAYWLRFSRDGYAPVFYGGGGDEWESQRVEVRVAEITGGINQGLTALGGIRGRVTDAVTGAPLAGINAYLDGVGVYTTDNVTTTAADGSYALASVWPGEHRVFLRDSKGVYRDGYAKGADGSETIMVQSGTSTGEVNAALLPAAAVTRKIIGTVTDGVTGQPIPGIRVALYDCYQSYHLECSDIAVAVTDADGKYTFFDPASAWGIKFSDPNRVYLSQEALEFRAPGPDETVVIDMALQKYEYVYGELSGRVTAAGTGAPLEGQSVCADNIGTDDYGCANTAADGTYRINGLRAGEYKVGFGVNNWLGARYAWVWRAEAVTVKPNEITVNIDGALPDNGRVAGTVYSADTGAPLANANVGICYTMYGCVWVETGADGAYVSYQPPGEYRVTAEAGGHQSRYYRDAATWAQAEPVTVTLGAVTPGIDITLPILLKGRIAGRVTDATTGAPIEGIRVRACAYYCYETTTDASGAYAFASLDERAYELDFADPKQRYAPRDASERVTVTHAQTATLDAQLQPYGAIAGRVTAAESGAALGGIEIRAGSLMLWTNPDGTYKIGPLPDGEYEVRFYDPGLLRRTDYRQAVRVKAGETTTGIDDAMPVMARARGRVVDAATGAPVVGVKVSGRGAWGIYHPAYTDADGRYDLQGLEDGTYSLMVNDRDHIYIDRAGEKVTFEAGTVMDMPDIKLSKWGEFGGTVTDAATGQPVAGVWVQLYDITEWGEAYVIGGCHAITGADGTYRIRGMDNWTVRPVFRDPQARYHAQSYGGGASLLDAREVTFERGRDMLGVDAALKPKATPAEEGLKRMYLPLITEGS